ncbi:hypothetical protein [Streptomyces filamentosus]|uniref:hypothetical protein n=1 Tax=Streptomyces filamentosus TaxID=67294 RepID=UPI0014792AE7|nr:hypothetical protein [Streptomyces filamentosus]
MATTDTRLAIALWLLTAAAGISFTLGNETALNALVGVGIPALAATAAAARSHHQRR